MDEPLNQIKHNYFRYIRASFGQTFALIVRRKQALVLCLIAMAPVILPLLGVAFEDVLGSRNGNHLFNRLVGNLYLKVLAPLVALFFGCLLVGEDVESQTMPHILTRPIPRSAWITGKFLAFVAVAALILVLGVGLVYSSCLLLEGLSFTRSSLTLLLHYDGVMVMALLSYGALCTCLGATVKRPIVLSLVIIYGWQRLAMLLPGVVDFLTIEKYLVALMPEGAVARETPSVAALLMALQKKTYLTGAMQATLVLLGITISFLILTTLVVRWREYSATRVLQG